MIQILKNLIIENYNPVEIANTYKLKNATCLSVLTEEDFFFMEILFILVK